jgi:hypothetical protein
MKYEISMVSELKTGMSQKAVISAHELEYPALEI